jgi:hypothetical protein
MKTNYSMLFRSMECRRSQIVLCSGLKKSKPKGSLVIFHNLEGPDRAVLEIRLLFSYDESGFHFSVTKTCLQRPEIQSYAFGQRPTTKTVNKDRRHGGSTTAAPTRN